MELTQDIYTLQDVSDILKLSKQTLYSKIKKGKVNATKFGKSYRLTKEQFKELLEKGFD